MLTGLLLDLLKRSAPPRRASSSSPPWCMRGRTWTRTTRSSSTTTRTAARTASTKLYNVYFAHELTDKLRGERVTVNALHPGLVKSRSFREPATTGPGSREPHPGVRAQHERPAESRVYEGDCSIYIGRLEDNLRSKVMGYFSDGDFDSFIRIDNSVYFVQPVDNIILEKQNYDAVVYSVYGADACTGAISKKVV
ncbi:hypothetical protein HPB52_014336 [Rhipicephalus sanguineus]|uniref:Uncharacterized protein n=1 Tax=Rhipicephalus sanguineus TaxID=34632 RepID=A0A9D4SWC2_RHISA|nr:hypothetical protein HPB52_014336 [Rhipicephalus sanguineus]